MFVHMRVLDAAQAAVVAHLTAGLGQQFVCNSRGTGHKEASDLGSSVAVHMKERLFEDEKSCQ